MNKTFIAFTVFTTDNGIQCVNYREYSSKTRIDPVDENEEKKLKCVYLRHGIHPDDLFSWMDKNLKGYWFYFDDAIIFLTHPEKDEILVRLVWG